MTRSPRNHEPSERLLRAARRDFSAPADLVTRVRASLANSPARPRWQALRWTAAAAATVAIALLLSLAPWRSAAGEPIAAVAAARGPVEDGSGRRVVAGDRLPRGGTIRTRAGGRVTLVTRGGSEFTLDAESRLAFPGDGRRARLEAGRIYCRNRRHEFDAVTTVGGTIALLGTTVDAATRDAQSVAVTVVQGEVRLENAHGDALVPAGRQALLRASATPTEGEAVDTAAETAWYEGRGEIISEAGEIAYLVPREGPLAAEVWAMRADGSGKRRVKTFTGGWAGWAFPGSWFPGSRQMLFSTGSLLWKDPDFARHQPRLSGRHILADRGPHFSQRAWVLDAATGKDVPFTLPAGYDILSYEEVSPDGRWLAFFGRYRPDPADQRRSEIGIWVDDLPTGAITKVLEGPVLGRFSWAPDGRHLAAVTRRAEGYYLSDYPVVMVDVATGAVQDVGVRAQEGGLSFSPDGTKLAYCGTRGGTQDWRHNRALQGSILVLDLHRGEAPRQVSPPQEEISWPRWSPDGTRLLYLAANYGTSADDLMRYALMVANADGSGSQEIYRADGLLRAAEWAPSGESVYVVAYPLAPGGRGFAGSRIFTVAADGSGKVTDLGGNAQDSVLSPAQAADTKAAFADLREAVYQYEVGQIRSYEGRAQEAKAAFRAAADGFASLVWKHPLSGFGTNDLADYADQAAALANQSDAALLQHTCQERITHFLSGVLLLYGGRERRFPPDFPALERWALTHKWGMNIEWIDHTNAEWVKMIFRCPEGDLLQYHPPAGGLPKVGDVIATCARHPECRLVWTEDLAGRLRDETNRAAERAKRGQHD